MLFVGAEMEMGRQSKKSEWKVEQSTWRINAAVQSTISHISTRRCSNHSNRIRFSIMISSEKQEAEKAFHAMSLILSGCCLADSLCLSLSLSFQNLFFGVVSFSFLLMAIQLIQSTQIIGTHSQPIPIN